MGGGLSTGAAGASGADQCRARAVKLDARPDLAGEGLEGANHPVGLAVARLHEDVAHPERLEPPEVFHDLVRRALKRPPPCAARARAQGEARAERDGQLLEAPLLGGAFRLQLAQARLEALRGGKGRVPAVGEGDDPPQRGLGVATHPDGNVAVHRLGEASDVREIEEAPLEARPLVPPAGAHDADGFVRPGPALVEGSAQELDLLTHPAHARPQDHASVRQMVEGGEGLGGQHGVTVGQDEHGGAEAGPLRDARDHAQCGQGLEEVRIGRERELAGVPIGVAGRDGVGNDHVIAGPQAVVAQPLHLAREGEEVRASGRGTEDGQVAAEVHPSSRARLRHGRCGPPARR